MLTVLQNITAAADLIESGDPRGAVALLTPLLGDDREPPPSSPSLRLARIFAESLLDRLEGDDEDSKNLYECTGNERLTLSGCQHYSEADMLAAYQVLVDKTPIIRFGHAVANAAIARSLAGEPNVHLIDIGIGRGCQWMGLLGELSSSPLGAPKVRLTGIELPYPGSDPAERLKLVGHKLAAQADAVGVPFVFEPIAALAENVESFPTRPGESIAINAAFSLHHTPAGDAVTDLSRSRDALLRRLRALKPRIFTLIEPDVEHNAGPLSRRVRAAVAHYAAVFDLLDTLLPGDERARTILEEGFFGREIHNIVSSEGRGRVERHESLEAWRGRITADGFEPIDLSPIVGRAVAALDLPQSDAAPPLEVRLRDGALQLVWKGTPLFAVSAWRPAVAVSRPIRVVAPFDVEIQLAS
jgi:hypothetical protein